MHHFNAKNNEMQSFHFLTNAFFSPIMHLPHLISFHLERVMSNPQQIPEPKLAAAMPTPMSAAPITPAKPPVNWRVLIVVAIVALAAMTVGGRMWWRSHYFVETDNAYLSGHVHPVSSRIAGNITRILVDDNQTVREGDLLAELDPADQRVKVEQIQAQIASAEQQVIQGEAQIAQARAQASAAVAQVAQSDAQLQRAQQDAKRYGELYTSEMKAVSKAEVDAANATRTGATADVAARRDAVLAAQAQIAAVSSAREVIKAQIKILQVQLKDAHQQLSYNKIFAPIAGRVGKRSMEIGARVQPGQQLAAIVQEESWVTANFKETQLAQLRPGQVAVVTIDAIPEHELNARIDSFSPASGAQFALLPADNATGNFTKIVQRIPVKIVFSAEDIKRFGARLIPGMSAIVEVRTDQPKPQALPAQPPVQKQAQAATGAAAH
jgi:membrane fusion protein (multidrug efflux system)